MKSVLTILVVLSSTIVRADGPQPTAEQVSQAREHYFTAEKAYRLGEFDRAIDEFKKSYELNPIPKLLFNLGQAHFRKEDFKGAQHFFRQFIATNPSGVELSSAQQKLADATRLLNDNASNSGTTKVANESLPKKSNTAAWVSLGLLSTAVVFGSIGAGFTIHGSQLSPESALTLDMKKQLQSQQSTEWLTGGILLGIGGAALIGSAISLGIWAYRKNSPTKNVINITAFPSQGAILLGAGGVL